MNYNVLYRPGVHAPAGEGPQRDTHLRHRYVDRPGIRRTGVARVVWPPSRTRAEAVVSGVGEGALFDEPGVHT